MLSALKKSEQTPIYGLILTLSLGLLAYNSFNFFFDHDIFETALLPLRYKAEGSFPIIKGLRYSPGLPLFLSLTQFINSAALLIGLTSLCSILALWSFDRILVLCQVNRRVRFFSLTLWFSSWTTLFVFSNLDDNCVQISLLLFALYQSLLYQQTLNKKHLIPAAISFGLALAVHAQAILIIPVYLLAVAWNNSKEKPLKNKIGPAFIFSVLAFIVYAPAILAHLWDKLSPQEIMKLFSAQAQTDGFVSHPQYSLLGAIATPEFSWKVWTLDWFKMFLQSINIWGTKAQKIPWVLSFWATIGIGTMFLLRTPQSSNRLKLIVLCFLGYGTTCLFTFFMIKQDPERWVLGVFFAFIIFAICLDQFIQSRAKIKTPATIIALVFCLLPLSSLINYGVNYKNYFNFFSYKAMANNLASNDVFIGHRLEHYSLLYFFPGTSILLDPDHYEIFKSGTFIGQSGYDKPELLKQHLTDQTRVLVHESVKTQMESNGLSKHLNLRSSEHLKLGINTELIHTYQVASGTN